MLFIRKNSSYYTNQTFLPSDDNLAYRPGRHDTDFLHGDPDPQPPKDGTYWAMSIGALEAPVSTPVEAYVSHDTRSG